MNSLLLSLLNGTAPFPLPVFEGEGAAAGADPAAAAPAAGAGDPPAGEKKPDAGGSFLADPDAHAAPAAGPSAFPDNWRDLMAGDDKDMRKALDRFKAPGDVGKSWREAQQQISKGIKAPARPADTDADGLKAWREAQGIPAEPTGYQLAEPVAKRFGDEDKPNMELFTTGMHKRDMPAGAVNAALDVYADMQEQLGAAVIARDTSERDACATDLRQEWGADFKANSALAKQFGEEAIPGVNWFTARLPDGRLLGSVPEVVKAFADLGREKYGDVHFAGDANTKVTESRMGEIKKMMADPKSEYYTDGGKTKSEYAGLLEAQSKAPRRGRDKEQ